MLSGVSSSKWHHSAAIRPQLRYIALSVASLCDAVHRGNAISRLHIATGRLIRSAAAVIDPRHTPRLAALRNGSALSAPRPAANSAYSTRAEAPDVCLAIGGWKAVE